MRRNVALITLILICSVICLCICSCNSTKAYSDELVNSDVVEYNVVSEENFSFLPQKVRLSEIVSVVADNSKTKVINATVLPESSYIKDLTWNIAWDNYSGSSAVTDYVIINPIAGTTSCNVTCLKKFRESYSIRVTATSVDNPSVSSSCIVTYEGAPESIKAYFGFQSSEIASDSIFNGSALGNGLLAFRSKYYNSLGLGSSFDIPELTNVTLTTHGTFTYNNGNSTGSLNAFYNAYKAELFNQSYNGSSPLKVNQNSIGFEKLTSLNALVEEHYGSSIYSTDCYFMLSGTDSITGLPFSVKFIV